MKKIIIKLKPFATVKRIEELDEALNLMIEAMPDELVSIYGFPDVIESITEEKE